MEVINSIEDAKIKGSVVTVGTFDGLHLGHKKILTILKKKSEELNLKSVVFTFWPHPRFVLGKAENLELLNTLTEKIQLLEDIGIDYLLSVNFTKEFASQSSYEFVKNILVNALNVKHLVLGYDHHFGKNREGRFSKLKSCADEFGFSVEQVSALKGVNENISSTKIRNLLKQGDIKKANSYLGYKYFAVGTVVSGNKIGRTIGFPTANILLPDYKLTPKTGVYAVNVFVDNKEYAGMLNIGHRPTIKSNTDKQKTIEVHIFDFNKDVYKKEIKISFVDRIRDEIEFENIQELKNQLEKDKKEVKSILNLK